MEGSPTVSVVLPVFNAERHVAAAVDSILRQTFADFELLTLDDGSTDATPTILADLATRDPRVRVVRGDRRGLIATLNNGFDRARGKYVARMDADDVAFPDRLAEQVNVLDKDQRLGMVGAAIVLVGEDLSPRYTVRYPVDDHDIRSALTVGNPFAHPVVTMRKAAFERAGGYRSTFLHAEDYDLWLRMADVARLANLPEPLLYYRVHPAQVSLQGAQQQVLSVTAAHISATARRAGLDEPFRHDQGVTVRDIQARRDLRDDVVPDLLLSVATSAAAQMIVAGDGNAALRLMDWALNALSTSRLSGRTSARLGLTRASAYWSRRDVPRCIATVLSASLRNPLATARLVLAAATAFASARQPGRKSATSQ